MCKTIYLRLVQMYTPSFSSLPTPHARHRHDPFTLSTGSTPYGVNSFVQSPHLGFRAFASTLRRFTFSAGEQSVSLLSWLPAPMEEI